jgi:uncharacterized protein (TIGR02145 family)
MQLATTLEKTNTIKLVWNYFKYNEDDSPSLFKMQNWRYLVDGWSSEWVTHTPLNPYKWEAWVTQWSIYSSTTDLPNWWSDLIVRDWNWSGYIIMDRNLWATNAYNWEEESKDVSVKIETRRWNYYQWWRNTTDWTNGSSSWNYDWQNPQNDNAWWNTIDTPFWINKTARQWPCPSGRHIPSTGEWDILFQTWCKNRQWMSCVISLWSASTWTNLWWKATLANFKNDLKLPFAGRHDGSNGSVLDQGLNGDYWSSSPTDADARGLYFYSSDVRPQCNNRRASGLSVRCFKN